MIVAEEVETWARLGIVTVMCGTSLTAARMPSAADDARATVRTGAGRRWLPARIARRRGTRTGGLQAVTRPLAAPGRKNRSIGSVSRVRLA